MSSNGKLVVGYNYPGPSNKFGNWLGPRDRQDKWPANYRDVWKDLEFKNQIRTNLKILQDNGVEIVRWFLMGNGFNYGLPPTVTYEGSRDAFGGVELIDFNLPDRLDPLFLDNFQQLLEIHDEVKMQLIPSLISFEFFSTHETSINGAGGRGAVAAEAKKRNTFLFTVLGEFLRISDKYRKWIYAWEVINEPAWDVRNITWTLTGALFHPTFVSPRDMVTFIYLALAWIKDKKFESTVGHRYLSDLLQMPTGSLPQYHYYAEHSWPFTDPPQLPPSASAKAKIIGEFGALVGKDYETNQKPHKASYGSPWNKDFPDHRDRIPANTVYERLRLIKQLGYELALVWPDLDDAEVDKVDGLKISTEKLASLKRFVTSQ
jgi:hypothetical protein